MVKRCWFFFFFHTQPTWWNSILSSQLHRAKQTIPLQLWRKGVILFSTTAKPTYYEIILMWLQAAKQRPFSWTATMVRYWSLFLTLLANSSHQFSTSYLRSLVLASQQLRYLPSVIKFLKSNKCVRIKPFFSISTIWFSKKMQWLRHAFSWQP